MEGLFGQGKTPAQKMKEYQRGIKKSVREMERERTNLERQEKKLMADIKKEAKEGRMDSAKIMAKDLVRTRGYIKKMFKMKSHMEAISLRLTTMQSSQQMVRMGTRAADPTRSLTAERALPPDPRTAQAQSMKGITKIMGRMNAKMNMPQIQKIMMEFEKQNEVMGMKEEMMDDAMDDAFADDADSEEARSSLLTAASGAGRTSSGAHRAQTRARCLAPTPILDPTLCAGGQHPGQHLCGARRRGHSGDCGHADCECLRSSTINNSPAGGGGSSGGRRR